MNCGPGGRGGGTSGALGGGAGQDGPGPGPGAGGPGCWPWAGWGGPAVGGRSGWRRRWSTTTSVLQSEALGAVSDSELAVEYATSRLRALGGPGAGGSAEPGPGPPRHGPGGGAPPGGHPLPGGHLPLPGARRARLAGADPGDPGAGAAWPSWGPTGRARPTLVKLLCPALRPGRGAASWWTGRTCAGSTPGPGSAGWPRLPGLRAVPAPGVGQRRPWGRLSAGPAGRCVEEAARRAGALDLIRALPRGWETVLSRRFGGGVELSGGQWQRVALARALLRRPRRARAYCAGAGRADGAPGRARRGGLLRRASWTSRRA